VAARLDGLLQSRGRYVQTVHVLGELKDTIACDISRARAELGYDPKVSLFEGMRASVRWCLERGQPI
jgi:nucleoside-diphosphate-sugar epimerase